MTIQGYYTNASIENTLNYEKSFGKHSVEALVGQSYRYGSAVLRESRAEGFTQPYYPVISNGETRSAKGSEFENALKFLFWKGELFIMMTGIYCLLHSAEMVLQGLLLLISLVTFLLHL